MPLNFVNLNGKLIQDSTLEKKVLNKFIYKKFLIRHSLSNSNSIYFLDDYNSFFNVSYSSLKQLNVFSKKNNYEGLSFLATDFVYANKLNISLRFKMFLASNKTNSISWINSMYNFFLLVKTRKTPQSILLLDPIKGGFNCYSSGVFGFLPRNHGFNFLKKKVFSLFKLNFLLNSDFFIRKHFVTRLLGWFGKMTFFPESRKNNFSKFRKKKKKKFSSNLNVVFISKKP